MMPRRGIPQSRRRPESPRHSSTLCSLRRVERRHFHDDANHTSTMSMMSTTKWTASKQRNENYPFLYRQSRCCRIFHVGVPFLVGCQCPFRDSSATERVLRTLAPPSAFFIRFHGFRRYSVLYLLPVEPSSVHILATSTPTHPVSLGQLQRRTFHIMMLPGAGMVEPALACHPAGPSTTRSRNGPELVISF
jgi:hypothetical protein